MTEKDLGSGRPPAKDDETSGYQPGGIRPASCLSHQDCPQKSQATTENKQLEKARNELQNGMQLATELIACATLVSGQAIQMLTSVAGIVEQASRCDSAERKRLLQQEGNELVDELNRQFQSTVSNGKMLSNERFCPEQLRKCLCQLSQVIEDPDQSLGLETLDLEEEQACQEAQNAIAAAQRKLVHVLPLYEEMSHGIQEAIESLEIMLHNVEAANGNVEDLEKHSALLASS